MQQKRTGDAFKDFVAAFYPDPSAQRRAEVAEVLYGQLRNPFAHSLGVLGGGTHQLQIRRLQSCNAANILDGLSEPELTAIEESQQRPAMNLFGVQGSGSQWEIIVDLLYRDALDMMVGLANDSNQMHAAETRFQQGTYVWCH